MSTSVHRTTSRAAALAVLTLVLGGCASGPPLQKPGFEPAPPEVRVTAEDNGGAIYQPATNRFFFEDIRARRVGDIINVILEESTAASKSASTNAARGANVDIDGPSVFGLPVTIGGRNILNTDVGASSDFNGAADSSQRNSLSGSIAVTVHEVLPNGLLRIRGEKVLTLNQGSEVVRVSGLVREVDVRPNNAVLSSEIADADITYGGNGLLADTNRAGWFTRLMSSILAPL